MSKEQIIALVGDHGGLKAVRKNFREEAGHELSLKSGQNMKDGGSK